MALERQQQIISLAQSALEHEPDRRDAFLAQACRGDASLRSEVEALLSIQGQATRPADNTNPDGPTGWLADAPTITLSDEEQAELFQEPNIGPYKIVRRIGQGGMGTVYLATRDDEQFKKMVAIKLVRQGMDSDFVLRRFRNERQILASLDHPNIARLLDGGTTSDGLPYFVMEYIEGKPLTRYADENRLSTVERLKLFRTVCSAVHYAHRNLVIHRDIKPSNILVTADGVPKLLDFGIAKLLNPDLAAQTIEATAMAIRLMTPEYASPEQVRGDMITTASDIYSLGVLLYELLTGHRPYRIKSRLPHDIARVVCEEEPQKPSTAIGRVETVPGADGATLVTLTPESVSRTREGQPDKLRRRLSGDIDNIVLMAMRKEPERRYASVDQLSNDIHRHLEGLPVIARKDTLAYRSAKFVKRNKAGALAALLILITLIGGIAATAAQRAKAERRFNEVRQLANSFLFEIHDAIQDLPGSTPARELLVKRALEYLDSLAQEEGNDISLQRELATAYQKIGDLQGNPYSSNLGDTAGAMQSYRKALAIREKIASANPLNPQDRDDLATIYSHTGDILWATNETQPAIDHYNKAVDIGEALLAANRNDLPIMRNLWVSYQRLGRAQAQAGDASAAIASFKRASVINEELVAANPDDLQMRRDRSANFTSMGEVMGETGDLAGSLESFRKAREIDQQIADSRPTDAKARLDLAIDYGNIGEVLEKSGDIAGALENTRKAQTFFEELAKADPANARATRNTAVYYNRLGSILARSGDFQAALENHRKATTILETLNAADSTNLLHSAELSLSYNFLSLMLAKTGSGARALETSQKAREIVENLSTANPENAELRAVLAFTYSNLGSIHATLAANKKESRTAQAASWREAREWFERSLEIYTDLKNRGAWTSATFGSPEQAAAEIAKCDAALAKLNA
ncbi:MAG TPA: protein kinase [Blastocatellia bacterium]